MYVMKAMERSSDTVRGNYILVTIMSVTPRGVQQLQKQKINDSGATYWATFGPGIIKSK